MSAVGTYIGDDALTISQVQVPIMYKSFVTIPSAATTPTPPTTPIPSQTPRERRRKHAKERLRRNEATILDQIETRLRTRLSTTS
jgi:hypothetical protein